MLLHIFSVHDSKAEAFITPFYCPTVAVATRSFQTAVNDPNTQFHEHPGDYTLFQLGTFDQDKATFEILETPKNLGLAITFKKSTIDSFREAITPLKEATAS